MKHVDRRWKDYPARNKGESPKLSVEQKSDSDCLKEKCAAISMDKPGNCMPRGSKTMKSNQLLCGRGFPCKDAGLKKGSFLKPILLIITTFYKFYTCKV